MSKEKDSNFEANLNKLELIVDKLESGDIGFIKDPLII